MFASCHECADDVRADVASSLFCQSVYIGGAKNGVQSVLTPTMATFLMVLESLPRSSEAGCRRDSEGVDIVSLSE